MAILPLFEFFFFFKIGKKSLGSAPKNRVGRVTRNKVFFGGGLSFYSGDQKLGKIKTVLKRGWSYFGGCYKGGTTV